MDKSSYDLFRGSTGTGTGAGSSGSLLGGLENYGGLKDYKGGNFWSTQIGKQMLPMMGGIASQYPVLGGAALAFGMGPKNWQTLMTPGAAGSSRVGGFGRPQGSATPLASYGASPQPVAQPPVPPRIQTPTPPSVPVARAPAPIRSQTPTPTPAPAPMAGRPSTPAPLSGQEMSQAVTPTRPGIFQRMKENTARRRQNRDERQTNRRTNRLGWKSKRRAGDAASGYHAGKTGSVLEKYAQNPVETPVKPAAPPVKNDSVQQVLDSIKAPALPEPEVTPTPAQRGGDILRQGDFAQQVGLPDMSRLEQMSPEQRVELYNRFKQYGGYLEQQGRQAPLISESFNYPEGTTPAQMSQFERGYEGVLARMQVPYSPEGWQQRIRQMGPGAALEYARSDPEMRAIWEKPHSSEAIQKMFELRQEHPKGVPLSQEKLLPDSPPQMNVGMAQPTYGDAPTRPQSQMANINPKENEIRGRAVQLQKQREDLANQAREIQSSGIMSPEAKEEKLIELKHYRDILDEKWRSEVMEPMKDTLTGRAYQDQLRGPMKQYDAEENIFGHKGKTTYWADPFSQWVDYDSMFLPTIIQAGKYGWGKNEQGYDPSQLPWWVPQAGEGYNSPTDQSRQFSGLTGPAKIPFNQNAPETTGELWAERMIRLGRSDVPNWQTQLAVPGSPGWAAGKALGPLRMLKDIPGLANRAGYHMITEPLATALKVPPGAPPAAGKNIAQTGRNIATNVKNTANVIRQGLTQNPLTTGKNLVTAVPRYIGNTAAEANAVLTTGKSLAGAEAGMLSRANALLMAAEGLRVILSDPIDQAWALSKAKTPQERELVLAQYGQGNFSADLANAGPVFGSEAFGQFLQGTSRPHYAFQETLAGVMDIAGMGAHLVGMTDNPMWGATSGISDKNRPGLRWTGTGWVDLTPGASMRAPMTKETQLKDLRTQVLVAREGIKGMDNSRDQEGNFLVPVEEAQEMFAKAMIKDIAMNHKGAEVPYERLAPNEQKSFDRFVDRMYDNAMRSDESRAELQAVFKSEAGIEGIKNATQVIRGEKQVRYNKFQSQLQAELPRDHPHFPSINQKWRDAEDPTATLKHGPQLLNRVREIRSMAQEEKDQLGRRLESMKQYGQRGFWDMTETQQEEFINLSNQYRQANGKIQMANKITEMGAEEYNYMWPIAGGGFYGPGDMKKRMRQSRPEAAYQYYRDFNPEDMRIDDVERKDWLQQLEDIKQLKAQTANMSGHHANIVTGKDPVQNADGSYSGGEKDRLQGLIRNAEGVIEGYKSQQNTRKLYNELIGKMMLLRSVGGGHGGQPMTDTEKTHYEQGARFDSFDGKPVDAPGAGRVPGEELLKSLMPQTKSQRQRGWEAVDKNMR